MPLRQFDFVEASISNNKKYQTIFLELRNLDNISTNYDKSTFLYSIDLERYEVVLKNLFQIQTGFNVYFFPYTKCFLYKYCGFGITNHVRLLLNIPSVNNSIPPFALPIEGTLNGYLPIDTLLYSDNIEIKEYYNAIWNDFIYSEDYNSEVISNKYQEIYTDRKSENNILSEKYIVTLGKVNKSTKKLILVISPRTPFSEELAIIKNNLTSKGYTIWDFSDPKKYPELYKKENSFDLYHLNGKGADIYTKILAKKHLEMK